MNISPKTKLVAIVITITLTAGIVGLALTLKSSTQTTTKTKVTTGVDIKKADTTSTDASKDTNITPKVVTPKSTTSSAIKP